MKYIIMCGGKYEQWKTPRHLTVVNGEMLVERTIRLLEENGVDDISISTDNPIFKQFNLPILTHVNNYNLTDYYNCAGQWVEAFYPTNEPTCYIFGDVYFSDEAIKTIIATNTKDIEFFASKPPFKEVYIKPWAEPFALKVQNTQHLKESIKKVIEYDKQGKWKRKPIMWELWQVIKGHELNTIDYNSYTAINDYTCDIDDKKDVEKLENVVKGLK